MDPSELNDQRSITVSEPVVPLVRDDCHEPSGGVERV